LGTGAVKNVSKEEALLIKEISQQDFDMLLLNLRIEAASIKDMNLEWKYEVDFL
jgi:hypothetical protein